MTPQLVKRGSLAIAAFGIGLAALTSWAAADPVPDRWAVVSSDGRLARHQGAVSSARIGRGTYEVVFASSVTRCVYQATLGNPGHGIPPVGKISVATQGTKGVLVVTRNSAGTPNPASFHLFVSCLDSRGAAAGTAASSAATAAAGARLAAGDRWAFVGTSGDLQDGRGVVETRLIGDGRFEVIFDRNVTGCAYIASLQSAGHQSDQIGVAARGRKPDGVFVLTTTYAGDPFGLGFYLALKCPPPLALAEAVTRRTDVADRWAVVRADGRLIRGLGVQSSVRVGKGQYMLRIDRKGRLDRCMFLVTLGAVAAGQAAPSGMGFATFYDGFNDGYQYAWVRTNAVPWTPPSSRADRPFHLYAVCR